MISYTQLQQYLLENYHDVTSVTRNYTVINMKDNKSESDSFENITDYHITIYKDQWDEYETVIGKPYYMFHISSNQYLNRCSSYFWVEKSTGSIKKIPGKYFQYNCETFSFSQSTRTPCNTHFCDKVNKLFQKILYDCFRKIN